MNDVDIIPYPNRIKNIQADLHLEDTILIKYPLEFEEAVLAIRKVITRIFNPPIRITLEENSKHKKYTRLNIHNIENDELDDEGYILQIQEKQIEISSNSVKGTFYGTISLFYHLSQLLSFSQKDQIQYPAILPCIEIIDKPEYKFRGFMLDEARHFQGEDTVKDILDIMALLKLNKFHWHLTEDQGWRIEIKEYPKLTEIGSRRDSTQIGGLKSYLTRRQDGEVHQGYYSQDEISDILEYAKDRHIEIIPEIDLPGHCMSLLAAYPELGCTGGPYEVQTTFGIKKDVLCIGKEKTFDVIQNILDEIVDLFPSKIIHIGGDEVPKSRWKNCEACQKRIRDEGLANESELHEYFTDRIINYLKLKGVTAVGWNQITHSTIDKGTIIQYWMGKKSELVKFTNKGGRVILSPILRTYLDYNYYLTPLSKVYNFIPSDEPFTETSILGVEAPLWTEWVRSRVRLDWQLIPRIMAISEISWTKQSNKNYDRFFNKVKQSSNLLESMGFEINNLDNVDPKWYKRIFLPILIFKEPNLQ